MRLVLIRHAQPEMHGRIYGRLDPALSATGRAQARALVAGLRGVKLEAVYASPLRRALETAERDGLRVVAVCPFVRAYIKRHLPVSGSGEWSSATH